MSRIKDLQKQVHRVLEKMEDEDKRLKAVSHLHGVALAAAVLAKKRGENAELATMAGLLHDLYGTTTGGCPMTERGGVLHVEMSQMRPGVQQAGPGSLLYETANH